MRSTLSCLVLLLASACASGPVPTAVPPSPTPSRVATAVGGCEQDRIACSGTAETDVDRRFCDAAFDACSMNGGLPSVHGS